MKNYIAEIINAFTYAIAFMQANETFQIIELALSIATSAVLIAYRLWKWYKAAKADGKITRDEISEGVEIVIEGKEEIADKMKAKKGEEKKDG